MFNSWSLPEELLNALYFNLIGVAVLLQILGAARLLELVPSIPSAPAKMIRWLAGGSFTLYLMHQPFLVFASAWLHPVEDRRAASLLALVVILVLCYLLAELGERRKSAFARLLRTEAGERRQNTASVGLFRRSA